MDYNIKLEISVKQAAGEYRISELGVWKLIRQGQIKSRTTNANTFIRRHDLAYYFMKNPAVLIDLQTRKK